MTIERYREIFKEKVEIYTDKQIADRIAYDRQFIQSFMTLVVENKLTIASDKAHHVN